jgi:hypothetical protein
VKPIVVIGVGVSAVIAIDQPHAIPLLGLFWIAILVLAICERVFRT